MRYARVATAMAVATGAVVTALASGPLAAASSTAFDDDPVTISGSGAALIGNIAWSRAAERVVKARFTGSLDAATDDCARVRVDWLDSGADSIGSATRSVCAGKATEFNMRKGSTALECVRVRLLVTDDETYHGTGPTRLVCAGGA